MMNYRGIPPNHRLAEREIIKYVHEGVFHIDEQGRIWRGNKRAEHDTGQYLQLVIIRNCRTIIASAHRLVWQYFNGDIPPGLCINHKNGKKQDNHPDNLEIVTYSENHKHAHATGLIDQKSERNPNCKISAKLVREIRNLYSTGKHKQTEIAKLYNIPFQTISRIVRGDTRRSDEGNVSTNNPRCFAKRDKKTGRFINGKITSDISQFPESVRVRELAWKN